VAARVAKMSGMKLPEWRPIPRHWKNDDDSKDFGAVLWLFVGPLLIVAGVVMFLFGLLRLFS
jgi:uncharacterized membrane protein